MMKTVHFVKTRKYLGQVKEAAQKVEVLKKRIEYCENAGMDTGTLPADLEAAMQDFHRRQAEVSGMIARIPNVGYQWILTKRYVELLDWQEIVHESSTKYRQVVSDHGLALPEMQDVLVDAGIVAPEDAEDIRKLLDSEGSLDIGTMTDYLKYREEKNREENKRGEV